MAQDKQGPEKDGQPKTSQAKPRHAVERARERYGVDLTGKDLQRIAAMVVGGEAMLQAKLDDGGTIWLLTYMDVLLRVVIAPDMDTVVTFLPMNGGFGRIRNPSYKQNKNSKSGWFRGGKKYFGNRRH